MNKQNASSTDKEFLERVARFLAEVEPDTPEELKAALREAGYDPNDVERQASDLLDRLRSRSPYDWRNRSRTEIDAERTRMATRTTNLNSQSRQNYIERIQDLAKKLGGEGLQLVTAHRNFESATDGDLASLLTDLEYLDEKRDRRTGSTPNE